MKDTKITTKKERKAELARLYPVNPYDKVMEEASEVIKEICKIRRFGFAGCYKGGDEDNLQRLVNEIDDLEDAISKLKPELLKERNVLNSQRPVEILDSRP